MCTNILTVRAWLLMSSLTHSTQHDCSVLFAMDEKWWGKTWQFFCLHSLESFFFFFIANQIKRLQFFLLSTHSTAQLSRENFFESRLQVFCDTSQFLHFSLFKKTLIHNDDTWLKFLICITRKKEAKFHIAIFLMLMIVNSRVLMMWLENTHIFSLSYELIMTLPLPAHDDDDAVRWIYSFFSRTVVDYGKIMSFIKIHTVVNDSYLGV